MSAEHIALVVWLLPTAVITVGDWIERGDIGRALLGGLAWPLWATALLVLLGVPWLFSRARQALEKSR